MAQKDRVEPAYLFVIEELIAKRKAAGLTQTQVAIAMGTDQSQVSKFERRERRLDLVDYTRYCLAINAEPSELIERVRQFLSDR